MQKLKGLWKRLFVNLSRALLLLLIFSLTNCDKDPSSDTEKLISYLSKPSLAMYGDSIIASWPVEEQLSDFNIIKFAFPGVDTNRILSSVQNDSNRYNACLYEGGINDFLENYSPTQGQVDATVNRQIQSIQILLTRCEHVVALNLWNIKFPWPTLAVVMINAEMKERITFVPRIDTELLIQDDMLTDGNHPNKNGYYILSKAVREQLQPFFPILYLNE
ncbi:SGNH/GDSL hydrolase family protein [Leptospira haakeii]|uniref:SGNH/GDSL hydrolase family protein n=1 Tax=Leptospira haakeii TaxID=2023198 RepID=A0ABX4PJP6_9LEPT|nr:SGNH/GDSL hydrolase family protein [Leptospira haakeii]PKA16011.1 SGNH/GDSL hydrolase family protein [Leptospira haakeii]PKA19202.1 SGNH/GDSL hydrolase family protein [Leptospira haakeii]